MKISGLPLIVSVLFIAAHASGAQVALRADFPESSVKEPLPVSGGVPFPKGAVKSVEEIRLLGSANQEIPCQVAQLAVWPDGSVKWAFVDAILEPDAGKELKLEYGPGVKRAAVADPLVAALDGSDAKISGGGVAARIRKSGKGFIDEMSLAGKALIAADNSAGLHVDTVRLPNAQALPVASFIARGKDVLTDTGTVEISTVVVESPGPIRATVLIRGVVLLPHFGATLPENVKQSEAPGRMPFSMRVSFFKNCPVIYAQNQIVFSGEPDCDFISHWGVELPGRAGPYGTLIVEPGVSLEQRETATKVADASARLCWAPLQSGFGLVRAGWQNRPTGITLDRGSAWIDFWPRAAGLWDLRRYAREWSVGESGNTKEPKEMEYYAKYAARGMAKTHDFVLYFGAADVTGAAPSIVTALSGRGMLLAPPDWYGSTEVLGAFAPELTSGEFAPFDAATRRELNYALFNQDLFQWYGKLTYGFLQSRFGQTHRNDRWDCDYGRWGWALADGGGRIGHMFMLEFLRTLDRRYFDAGEAFSRITYDTNMVHTALHIENTTSWWNAAGLSHRHNVQPFGCPYNGLRGSYPVGQRILYLLTNDGVIKDGLELVVDAAMRQRLGHSGGSDGQGSAANSLLWKYEVTGDKQYLDACRGFLDTSNLVPPKNIADMGYGPAFGLFNAAGEYAELSGDKAFQQRIVELANIGAKAEHPGEFIYAIATGYRLSKDESLKAKLESILDTILKRPKNSLADLPEKDWPGHAGWRSPALDPNQFRDLPYALAVLSTAKSAGFVQSAVKAAPAQAPVDWYKPGGAQSATDKIPAASDLLKLTPGAGGGELACGAAKFKLSTGIDAVEINSTSPLKSPIVFYVDIATLKDADPRIADSFERHAAEVQKFGKVADGSFIGSAKAGPVTIAFRLRADHADGVPTLRVESACNADPAVRIASWGLLVPLKMGADAHALQTTAPGRFRLERCRLDQNDERIPNWLTSEYHWGEGAPLWPKWRESGIQAGPGDSYRIWRANRSDVVPLYCDQGRGAPAWFDFTDRGAAPRWGLTARVLRPAASGDNSRQAIRMNFESGVMEIQFHDAGAESLSSGSGLSGAADLIFHDGWRPPLAKPELTAAQYEKFIDDLNYNQNYGLNALRFALSITHQVDGRVWPEKVRDLGIEPREILYGMQYGDGLKTHCEKLKVKFDANDVEATIKRILEHYKGN
jgi:hypothetical protein